jgi:hypothetical protein
LRENTSVGAFTGTFSIPQYAEAGTWTVDYVSVRDNAGNYAYYYGRGTYYDAYENYTWAKYYGDAATFEVTSITDNTPPVVSNVRVSPTVVSSGGRVTIYANATDDVSGVYYLTAYARSPSGSKSVSTGMWENTSAGAFMGTFSIPQYTEAGTWTVVDVSAYDRAGNYGSYYAKGYYSWTGIKYYGDAVTFEVQGLALAIKITSAPAEARPGDNVIVKVDLTNNTAATASGVELYGYVGNVTSGVSTVSLAPGETKTLALSIKLDGLAPGTYTLGVVAKYGSLVGEDKWSISVVS